MPEVSLRAYGRQIDELIEREKLEEAIAHCRYVLQIYPKHLETYRLLGKAYLEYKRFGDAADIFQRVLSAVPDDFVSHIGMAIVREDEGNLDAAIWHMERAFETNPSNPAIQQEMKRLIGRRDGLEPHKVRLTRGALARMYAQGELYAQAIAELRSALQEDHDRPDLQVLLADMFWRTDQRPEATSIANQILEKLPYCVDANRILAANLQARERIEEAAVYHRRLASLDPYAAFIEKATEDAATVEEGAVALEKLEWRPGEPMPTKGPAQPSWAATLGMEMQRDREAEEDSAVEQPPQTGPLPSWLELGESPPFETGSRDEVEQPSEEPAEPEQPDWLQTEAMPESGEAVTSEDEFLADLERRAEALPEKSEEQPESGDEEASEIPDWMQEAGWTEATGEAVEQPVSFTDDELQSLEAGELPPEPSQGPADDEELSPADLPEWIHDMAPEEGAEGEIEVEPASDGTGELPSWLAAGRPPVESDIQEQPAGEAEASPEPASTQDRAEDMSAIEAAPDLAPAEPMATERAEPEIPLPSADDGKELPTWITDETPGATDTIVTWLGGQDRERERASSDEPEEPTADALPSWMIDTGPLEETSEAGIGLPGPEADAEPEPVTEQQPAEPPSGAPGWLSAVAEVAAQEDRPAEAAEPEAEPSDMGEEISGPEDLEPAQPPDWLAEVVTGPGDTMDADEIIAETARMQEETAEEAPAEATPAAMQAEAADSDDWLRDESLEAEPQISADTPDWLKGLAEEGPGPAEAAPATEPPDWLRDIAEPGREAPDLPTSAPEAVEATAGIEQPEPEPPPELTQFEAPTERPEAESVPGPPEPAGAAMEPPDWLQGIGEESEAQAADAGAPDWLTGIAEEDLFETEIPEGIPEGLGLQPEPEPEPEGFMELGEPETPAPPPAEEDDEVIRWLEDLASAQEETEIPETIQQASSAQPETPMLEERQFPEDSEEGLEWLEELADQRGLDVDVRLPQARPPAEPAAAPAAEPVFEFEAEAPGPPEAPEVSEEDSAPDWLARMSTQPVPQVDLEALQAAAAEAERPEPEQVEPQVDPAAETIKTRSEDLQAELARRQAEPPERAEEPEPMTEDEVPEWLVQAAAAEAGDSMPEPIPAAQEPVAAEPERVEPPVAPEVAPPGPSEAEAVQPSVSVEPIEQAPPPVSEAPTEAVEAPAPAAPVEQPPAAEPQAETVEAAAPVAPAEETAPAVPAAPVEQPPAAEPQAETIEAAPPAAPAEETAPAVPAAPVEQPPVAAEPPVEIVEAATPTAPAEETTPAVPAAPVEQPPAAAEPQAETVEAAAPAAPAEETAPSVPAAPVEQPPAVAEPPVEIVEAAAPAEETAPSVPAAPVEQPPAVAEPPVEIVEAAAPAAPAPETEQPIAAEAPSETLGAVPATEGELTPEPQAAPETVEPAAAEAPPAEPEPALSETVVPDAELPAPETLSAEPETIEMAEATEQAPAETEQLPQPVAAEEVEPARAEAEPVKQTKELIIDSARQALASGDTAAAVELYGKMIKRKDSLESVIEDLRIAVDRAPDDALLWQTLGDAYMKNDQSAEAIEAYRKGMEAA